MSYKLGPAHPGSKELERLAVIYAETFAESPWGERHDPRQVQKTLQHILDMPDAIFLMALDADSIPVGAMVGFSMDRKPELCARMMLRGRVLFIDELFVVASARGNGVAAMLVAGMISSAKIHGFHQAVVSTSIHEPVVRHLFLDHHGFTVAFEEDYIGRHLLPAAVLPTRRVVLVGSL
ncbi:GNAT family N-acetyltransferase [Candidatus Uhrbacteria bacterium]|nr:GNAT family N-acetyltransferase [Candidatus Uhrbacteria bacterium]